MAANEFPRFFESEAAYSQAVRAHNREKNRVRWFGLMLLAWTAAVMLGHFWPHLTVGNVLHAGWLAACGLWLLFMLLGLVAATLGFVTGVLWVCSMGRVLDD